MYKKTNVFKQCALFYFAPSLLIFFSFFFLHELLKYWFQHQLIRFVHLHGWWFALSLTESMRSETSVSHVMWLMSLFVSKSTKVIFFFRCEGRFTRFIQSNFDSKTHFYGGLCLRMSLSWIGYTFKGCVVCTMKIVDSIYLTSLLFSFFFFDRCMHLTLRKLLIGEVILSLCYDAYVLSMLVNNWWTREKKTIAPSHIQMMRMKLKEKNVFAAIV